MRKSVADCVKASVRLILCESDTCVSLYGLIGARLYEHVLSKVKGVHSAVIAHDCSFVLYISNEYELEMSRIYRSSELQFSCESLCKEEEVITCLCLSTKDNYFAYGTENGKVVIGDVKNKAILQSFHDHHNAVTSIGVVRKEEGYFVSASDDGMIFLYSKNSPRMTHRFLHGKSVGLRILLYSHSFLQVIVDQVKMSPFRNNWLVSSGVDGRLLIWDILSQSKVPKFEFVAKDPANFCFSFAKNESEIFIAEKNILLCWDLKSNQVREVDVSFPYPIISMEISHGKLYLLTSSPLEPIQIYNFEKNWDNLAIEFNTHSGQQNFSNILIGKNLISKVAWDKFSNPRKSVLHDEANPVFVDGEIPSAFPEKSNSSKKLGMNGVMSALALTSPVKNLETTFSSSKKRKPSEIVTSSKEFGSFTIPSLSGKQSNPFSKIKEAVAVSSEVSVQSSSQIRVSLTPLQRPNFANPKTSAILANNSFSASPSM